MFTESTDLYDAIYRSFKDFATESAAVAATIRSRCPNAHTVLDVGCGTGEHAKYLSEVHGFSVDGLDIDAGLLSVARSKVPCSEFFEADMAGFELGRRFDVVLCLFSSIAYLKTLDRITSALAQFRRHLKPNGLIMIEPWYEPGVLREGVGTERCVLGDGIQVTRSAFTRIENGISLLDFTYRVEAAEHTRIVQERHELGVFSKDDMLRCFSDAQLLPEYETPGLSDRGLYIAKPVSRAEG